MNDRVEIAVQLHPQHADYSDIRDAVGRAEDAGFDILYNWDHFYPLYGDADGKHFECWTMLGAWAEQTTRIKIGALVTCNSYRNPELLADMARTVDHMSGGRLVFGVGSGWFERDYDEFGYEFGTAGDRLRSLDAALPRIKERWSKSNPTPSDIPILIGGGGEKVTLRIVAEHAQVWHYFGSPDEMKRKSEILDEWCAKVGRDPKDIRRAVSNQGPETQMLEDADMYYDLGYREFTLGLNGPDYNMDVASEWLAWRDEKNAAT